MKYLIFLNLFNLSLLSAGNMRISTPNQLYLFTYMSGNVSLGWAEGAEKFKVLMKNGNILSTWSLKTGFENKDVQSFSILMDAII